MDCLYEGLISIGVGLEYNPDTAVRSDAFMPRVSISALWLRLLTKEIYQACCEGKYKNRGFRVETAWKGAPGYSVERWNYWKSRLQDLAASESTAPDVKKACGVCALTMDAAAEHGTVA